MDERYNHYVILGIPLDLDLDLGKLNEKGEKRETKKNIRKYKMESK